MEAQLICLAYLYPPYLDSYWPHKTGGNGEGVSADTPIENSFTFWCFPSVCPDNPLGQLDIYLCTHVQSIVGETGQRLNGPIWDERCPHPKAAVVHDASAK